MLKKMGVILLTGSLVLGSVPATGQAANLSRLLGAQRSVASRTSDASERPNLGAQPRATRPLQESSTLDSLHNTTPKFPLLRKLVGLYLLWLLFNPYK